MVFFPVGWLESAKKKAIKQAIMPVGDDNRESIVCSRREERAWQPDMVRFEQVA